MPIFVLIEGDYDGSLMRVKAEKAKDQYAAMEKADRHAEHDYSAVPLSRIISALMR